MLWGTWDLSSLGQPGIKLVLIAVKCEFLTTDYQGSPSIWFRIKSEFTRHLWNNSKLNIWSYLTGEPFDSSFLSLVEILEYIFTQVLIPCVFESLSLSPCALKKRYKKVFEVLKPMCWEIRSPKILVLLTLHKRRSNSNFLGQGCFCHTSDLGKFFPST